MNPEDIETWWRTDPERVNSLRYVRDHLEPEQQTGNDEIPTSLRRPLGEAKFDEGSGSMKLERDGFALNIEYAPLSRQYLEETFNSPLDKGKPLLPWTEEELKKYRILDKLAFSDNQGRTLDLLNLLGNKPVLVARVDPHSTRDMLTFTKENFIFTEFNIAHPEFIVALLHELGHINNFQENEKKTPK